MEKNQILGIVSPVVKGEWQSGVVYDKLNIVRNGSSAYIAKVSNLSVEPGTTENWDNFWMLLATDGIVTEARLSQIMSDFKDQFNELLSDYVLLSNVSEEAAPNTLPVRGEAAQLAIGAPQSEGDAVNFGTMNEQTANPVIGTASGSVVTVEDAARSGERLNVVSRVDFVKVEGSPTPDNVLPVTGWKGANLCLQTPTNGVTFFNFGDGGVSFIGTAIDNAQYRIPYAVTGGNTYTVELEGVANTEQYIVWVQEPTGTIVTKTNVYFSNNTMEFEAVTDGTVYIMIRVKAGMSVEKTRVVPKIKVKDATEYDYPAVSMKDTDFSVDFGQTIFSGELDWNAGTLTVDKMGIVLTGEEDFVSTANKQVEGDKVYNRYDLNLTGRVLPLTESKSTVCCSHYPVAGGVNLKGVWVARTSEKLGVRIMWLYSDANELKTYLAEQYAAGTPVTFVYEVSPVTLPFDPKDIRALEGVNVLACDTGDITVNYHRDINAAINELKQLMAQAISIQ